MSTNTLFITTALGSMLLIGNTIRAEVTIEPSERGALVKIDGELFTEYLSKAGQSPAMWPIIGPTGAPMTRSYPVGPTRKGETADHPHHQSLWFAHDRVNDVDYWKANVNAPNGASGAHIAQRSLSIVEGSGSTARIDTRNDWMNGDDRVLQDERTVVYGKRPNGDRWIDFTIVLMASDGDATFGDTKEGTFAVRVADSMRLEAEQGGRVVNSAGQQNDEAWGRPARWVDYSGPVEGETAGIAIMSHPDNFRPLPRWHVRGYGLFTANPFGERDFPAVDGVKQGPVTIRQGKPLKLRYRVLLHRGRAEEAGIQGAFKEFAADRSR